MDLLEKILKCEDDELDAIVTDAINKANEESNKVDQLGFLLLNNVTPVHKGFIPLDTRIKYSNNGIETYSMKATDYFYDFARYIRKNQVANKSKLLFDSVQTFILDYFGEPLKGQDLRNKVLYEEVFEATTTDDEFFEALKNNDLSRLKGRGVALCSERAAMAQQLLSILGFETYYCMGCLDNNGNQDGHSFNIVKARDNYALMDYSVSVSEYYDDGTFRKAYAFAGIVTNEEFREFIEAGKIKEFDDYAYFGSNGKQLTGTKRCYAVGVYEFTKEEAESKHTR